ncbi:AAA family ATPase [Lamprobacter modestohalophilus]|uniref:AAA family ATPase n=1 Tax=Lamprobacter modestohalophilus TaxID=1064514 RepID=UPI00190416CD|nr:AAA family ATPase [Lamprobacter modestohalophilus]
MSKTKQGLPKPWEQHQDAFQRAIISRAERALLSGLMIEPNALSRIVDLVSPADFSNDDHGEVFAAILALSDDGIAPEPETLMNALNDRRKRELIVSLFADATTAANATHDAKCIQAAGARRRLSTFGGRLAEREDGRHPAELIEWTRVELDARAVDEPMIETRSPPRRALIPSEEEIARGRLAPRCIVDRYLYADVAQVVGPSGTGKTTLLLYEAAMIALGAPLWGLRIEQPGWTLFVTAEDRRERLLARLREIVAALKLSEAQRRRVFDSVIIWDLCGSSLKLTPLIQGNVVLTRLADDLGRAYRDDRPAVVTFDPLVSFGASEQAVNDNEQALITSARRIVRTLDCCVRFVHHTGQANVRATTLDPYSGRGGSALADGSCMTTVLQAWNPDDESHRRPPPGCKPDPESSLMILTRAKLSDAPPHLPEFWIKRTGYAFERFVELKRSPEEAAADQADQLEH